MSKRMLMILAVFVSGWLPALSYADEQVDFYFRFLASYVRSPDSIRNNLPARSEQFFRRHGVKNVHELRLGFNRAQLAELAQKLAEEYQRVLKNPRSMVRTNALELLHEFVRDLDPQLAARLPRPQHRQSSGVGPQNAIEDSIKVNQQTMGLGQAAINQGYILGESQGQLRMPKVTRPRNPTPGSFADRFPNRIPDQLGNDLGKQTGQLLDLDSLRPAPTMNQASRPAINQNQDPGEGFEFNEGGFLTPDANFEPDPPGQNQTDPLQREPRTPKGYLLEDNGIKSLQESLDLLKNSPGLDNPDDMVAELNELRQQNSDRLSPFETETAPYWNEADSTKTISDKSETTVGYGLKSDLDGKPELEFSGEKVIQQSETNLGPFRYQNTKTMSGVGNLSVDSVSGTAVYDERHSLFGYQEDELYSEVSVGLSVEKGALKYDVSTTSGISTVVADKYEVSVGAGYKSSNKAIPYEFFQSKVEGDINVIRFEIPVIKKPGMFITAEYGIRP